MPGRHFDQYHGYYGAYCRFTLTSGTVIRAILVRSQGPYLITSAPAYAIRMDEVDEIKVIGR